MSLLRASLEPLAELLGLDPRSELLALAVTHSSYAAEHDCRSNERLEFLGDAVVDLAVADLLVTRYPDLDEGTGSLVRSGVVNESSLARAAERLGLPAHLLLGRGEVKSKGAERPSLLADAFEAVVAALFLEEGYERASHFVQDVLADDIAAAAARPHDVDPKTRLRQWSETAGLGPPAYDVTSSGPAHAVAFEATVSIGAKVVGRGVGRSKKLAEAEAAADAWKRRSA